MQQLARIAIRQDIGEINFELYVHQLSVLLPRPLLKYVAEGQMLVQFF